MSTPESPVTPGTTRPAGEGLSDAEAAAEVAQQTSPDLKAADVFERESEGATTDRPADELTAEDLTAEDLTADDGAE
ncbi:MAG TPA: hypothetical protein VHD58_04195 [Mycobacteriales bacterium]|nr:hypothetical protein [Mycobacteriales bacterium]